MIDWKDWQPINDLDKEHVFLRELRREIENNPDHPLFGKEHRIIAWKPGEDDFILQLSETRYAYLHLTWHHETNPQFPHCELFENEDALNEFLIRWASPDAS